MLVRTRCTDTCSEGLCVGCKLCTQALDDTTAGAAAGAEPENPDCVSWCSQYTCLEAQCFGCDACAADATADDAGGDDTFVDPAPSAPAAAIVSRLAVHSARLRKLQIVPMDNSKPICGV